ncbi:MAG TPA: ABC transporter substrate-binding protein [Casimicrobiaceae bacterium]|jgi:putative ABC transport system substrate-binding protein
MMDRRAFIVSAATGVLAMPLGAFAQQSGKVWRIGFFYFGSRQSALDTGRYNAFVQGLRELGYVEGKNIIIEARFGDGKIERAPGLAANLVQSKVDVIVATGSVAYRALQHATTSIPVVITVTNDPVTAGLAASIAQPGGNFTGLADTAVDLGPKQLELLRAPMPQLSRVGVLLNPDNVTHPAQMKRLMLAAQKIGIQVVLAEAGTAAEIESGFGSLAQYRADAVILFADTYFTQQSQQIAQAALKQRLPSIYNLHEYAKVGGLMSYGADLVDNFRRAATYVDKILKGAKPGELPFEQPTRYSLAINVKTAKALGLTIPQSMLLRADEVIQ